MYVYIRELESSFYRKRIKGVDDMWICDCTAI